MPQPDAPLIAIVPAAAAEAAFADPFLRAEGLSAASGSAHAAIFAQSASGPRAATSPAAARRRVLDGLICHGDVLAVAPDAELPAAEAGAVLAAHAGLLEGAFAAIAGRVEQRVRIGWTTADAPWPWRTDALPQPGLGGCPLPEAAEALRGHIATALATEVAASVEDAIALPLDGPERLAHVACLLRPADRPALETAVRALSSIWPEGLDIRLDGPRPPQSFATVVVERPSPDEAAAAAALLGVGTDTSGAALRQALRARMHAAPLAAGPRDEDEAGHAPLRRAESLLGRLAAARACTGLAWPLLLGLRREPGPDPAAGLRTPRVEAAA